MTDIGTQSRRDWIWTDSELAALTA